VYHLTLEPHTYFATHPPKLPDDDLAATMLDRIVERVSAEGLARYEV
jgi:oxygen-independent coproporphyrinogen-3 oxidase